MGITKSKLPSSSDISYGRFLGTDFYMTAEHPSEITTNDAEERQGQLKCKYGRQKRPIKSYHHHSGIDASCVSLSASKGNEVMRSRCKRLLLDRESVCAWVVSLSTMLKGHPIPPEAKTYIRCCIRQQLDGIMAGDIIKLYTAMYDLKILSDEFIGLFMHKIIEMRKGCISTNEKESLAEVMIAALSHHNLHECASSKELESCMVSLRADAPFLSPRLQYRMAVLYTNMFPKGMVSIDDIEALILILMDHPVDIQRRMSLHDCVYSIDFLKLLKAYLTADVSCGVRPFAHDVERYLDDCLLPRLKMNVYMLTAAQITDVLSFLSETGIKEKHELLEACCNRFTRDISQFSFPRMLEFNQALLYIGHPSEKILLHTISNLPRRVLSITSVDQLISLLRIAKAGRVDSDLLRSFVTEHLLQLAHKLGRKHCEALFGLLTPQYCYKEGLEVIEHVSARYMLKPL